MNPNDPRLIAARKASAAGTLTKEEYREVISIMREGRQAAHVISKRAKEAKAGVNTDALLGELFQ